MDALANLAEALLASLLIVGTAALQMILLVWIILAAFAVIVLLRWGVHVAWHSGVAAYHRAKRRG